MQQIDTIGIIAGNRTLPLAFAEQARAQGVKRLVAIAFENETNPALAQLVDEMVWLKVGQLSKLIAALKERGVAHCVMLGQIAPKNLFDVRPDLRAVAMLMKLKERNAHSIFGALADELKKDGITLIEPIHWLAPLIPAAGFSLGPKLTAVQKEDIAFGFRIAKEISRLEIGQMAVVKEGTVLAVEGFEGTDQCLRRGGELSRGSGAVAVKVAKEKHDLRFDIPCIGAQTIETCAAARVSTFVFEAGRTLLLERDVVETLAKKHKIALVAWSSNADDTPN
jgi:UDP-2,3-diacylglucosamine hydrolase